MTPEQLTFLHSGLRPDANGRPTQNRIVGDTDKARDMAEGLLRLGLLRRETTKPGRSPAYRLSALAVSTLQGQAVPKLFRIDRRYVAVNPSRRNLR